MKKNYKTIGIVSMMLVISLVLIIYYLIDGNKTLLKNNNEDIFVEETPNEIELRSKEIVVEIKGEVKSPNVYWMNEEDIVEDLIIKAGGLTENADIRSINRADILKNHQSIDIPNKDETLKASISGVVDAKSTLININTANSTEIQTLPGIGPSKAENIIKYREESGGFKSIDEIKNISGIGEATFEKLKDKITV